MEDAHSAVIGIPDQKENVSWFAGKVIFCRYLSWFAGKKNVSSLKVIQINHQEDPADNRSVIVIEK